MLRTFWNLKCAKDPMFVKITTTVLFHSRSQKPPHSDGPLDISSSSSAEMPLANSPLSLHLNSANVVWIPIGSSYERHCCLGAPLKSQTTNFPWVDQFEAQQKPSWYCEWPKTRMSHLKVTATCKTEWSPTNCSSFLQCIPITDVLHTTCWG